MEIFSRLSAKSTRPNPLHSQLWRSPSPHIQFYYELVSSLHNHDSLLFVLFDVHSIPRSSTVQSGGGGREILSNFHFACFSMWFSSHSEVKRVKHKKAHHKNNGELTSTQTQLFIFSFHCCFLCYFSERAFKSSFSVTFQLSLPSLASDDLFSIELDDVLSRVSTKAMLLMRQPRRPPWELSQNSSARKKRYSLGFVYLL